MVAFHFYRCNPTAVTGTFWESHCGVSECHYAEAHGALREHQSPKLFGFEVGDLAPVDPLRRKGSKQPNAEKYHMDSGDNAESSAQE